jgi:hypothetical protein
VVGSTGSPNGVDDGLLHHILVSINQTSVTFYVDGVQYGSVQQAPRTVNECFGTGFTQIGAIGSSGFSVVIRDVLLFTRALSASQVDVGDCRNPTPTATRKLLNHLLHVCFEIFSLKFSSATYFRNVGAFVCVLVLWLQTFSITNTNCNCNRYRYPNGHCNRYCNRNTFPNSHSNTNCHTNSNCHTNCHPCPNTNTNPKSHKHANSHIFSNSHSDQSTLWYATRL